MANNWQLIYSTDYAHLAEIVRAVLSDHEIATTSINKKDSMHGHLTVGSIEIYCQPEQVIKAKHLINKHEL